MAILDDINQTLIDDITITDTLRDGIENLGILSGIDTDGDTPSEVLSSVSTKNAQNIKDLGNFKTIIEREQNTNLVVPGDITRIGRYALYDVTSRVIDMSDCAIDYIDEYGIGECTDIIGPKNSVVNITANAFSTNNNTNYPKYMNNNKWVQLASSSLGSVTIDDSVELIINGAASPSTITSINVPTSLKGICEGGLAETSVITFTAPQSLVSLQKYCFSGCTYLATIDLSLATNLKKIDQYAFLNCVALSSITLPTGLEEIDEYVFSNVGASSGSLAITLPSSVNKLAQRCFYNSRVNSITLNGTLKEIPSYCFYGCTNLNSVTFDANSQIETLFDHSFQDCTALTTIIIPEGVKTISWDVFNGCTNLTRMDLPSTLISLGDWNMDSPSLTTLNYNGTMDDWDTKVELHPNWNSNGYVTTIHCTDGDISIF